MANWIPVIVAVVSAILAGLFALRTKRTELRAQRYMHYRKRSDGAKRIAAAFAVEEPEAAAEPLEGKA